MQAMFGEIDADLGIERITVTGIDPLNIVIAKSPEAAETECKMRARPARRGTCLAPQTVTAAVKNLEARVDEYGLQG